MFRFSIRECLLVTAITALSLGWWLDHRRMALENSSCARVSELRKRQLQLFGHLLETKGLFRWDADAQERLELDAWNAADR